MSPLEILQNTFGYSAFRPGQEEIVNSILSGRDALCVMPTGGGKSICYQIPSLTFKGTTLVISPLISLMRDQVTMLRKLGIAAECLTSGMENEDYEETFFAFSSSMVQILYVSPERLQLPSFAELCQHLDIPFVAVDEAHCISQWGQDFRPAYLCIEHFIRSLPKRPVVAAFTATAAPRVREDIRQLLGMNDPAQFISSFDRPNLSFTVCEPVDRDDHLISLLRARYLQSGIIYCQTRKAVESVCEDLCRAGFRATRYHAGLPREERDANQQAFLRDEKTVMVATNAFGMGIDKSNVSYVIHYQMPMSLEAYYQEAGRAGRDGCDADCILLYRPEDVHISEYLIDHSEPNPDFSPEEQESVREKQHERLKQMLFYATSRRCLRQRILRYFGEEAPAHCGNCSSCVKDCQSLDVTVDAQKILSCVARVKEQGCAAEVADILLGIATPCLLPDLDVTGLSTFGIIKNRTRKEVLLLIEFLCRQGHLMDDLEDGHRLKLTESARDVLFRGQRVTIKQSEIQKANDSQINDGMLRELKYTRLRLASFEHVAAFTLFTDASLLEICRKMPVDLEALSQVEGIGRARAKRYGPDLMVVVNKYRNK